MKINERIEKYLESKKELNEKSGDIQKMAEKFNKASLEGITFNKSDWRWLNSRMKNLNSNVSGILGGINSKSEEEFLAEFANLMFLVNFLKDEIGNIVDKSNKKKK